MCWLIVILGITLAGFLVWASAYIGSNVYVKSICRCVGEKKILLTFDDGPDAYMTPRVLDVLKKNNIQAVFFLVGSKVEKYPDIVKRIVDEKHIVGNHTYSHSFFFPFGNANTVMKELQRCNEAIAAVTDKSPVLFRPPFGVTNPIIGKVVRSMGFLTMGWSIRSLDTISRRKRWKVCEQTVNKLHSGAIILLHDRCAGADVLLQDLISAIVNQGYGFVSINELLKGKIHEK